MTARTARLRLPIDARFFGATELRLPDIAAGLLLLTSAALWLTALPSIDVRRMSDLGLISVLPPQVIASVNAAWQDKSRQSQSIPELRQAVALAPKA